MRLDTGFSAASPVFVFIRPAILDWVILLGMLFMARYTVMGLVF
jgi:hypothetical protein